jgi:DNA-binding MarR family transcriptional regulator
MNKVLDLKEITSPTEAVVAAVIADHCGEDGKGWIGVSRIAAHSRYSEATVRRAIRELEEAGLLVVHSNAGEFRTNLYELRIDDNGEVAHTQQPGGN